MRKDEKEYLDANFVAIRAELKADRDIFTLKVDQIIANQNELKPRVQANTLWRIRITAVASAVATIFGFILFKFSSLITGLKELINIE